MKLFVLVLLIFSGFASSGFCGEVEQLLSQSTNLPTGDVGGITGLLGNLSFSGFIGGLIFGSIGFAAFIYGKKTAGFKPMVLGAILMIYPYFVRGNILLYAIGISLTAALFIFRE